MFLHNKLKNQKILKYINYIMLIGLIIIALDLLFE